MSPSAPADSPFEEFPFTQEELDEARSHVPAFSELWYPRGKAQPKVTARVRGKVPNAFREKRANWLQQPSIRGSAPLAISKNPFTELSNDSTGVWAAFNAKRGVSVPPVATKRRPVPPRSPGPQAVRPLHGFHTIAAVSDGIDHRSGRCLSSEPDF